MVPSRDSLTCRAPTLLFLSFLPETDWFLMFLPVMVRAA